MGFFVDEMQIELGTTFARTTVEVVEAPSVTCGSRNPSARAFALAQGDSSEGIARTESRGRGRPRHNAYRGSPVFWKLSPATVLPDASTLRTFSRFAPALLIASAKQRIA